MRFLIPCLALIGCIPPDAAPPPKVRGNYELKHENRLTLRLNVGGAITERTAEGYDEVVDFGTHEGQPIVVDLGKFCDKPDVACPTEALWERVAIDQPNLDSNRLDAYVINVIDNTTRELPPGKRADVLGGIVSSADDRFLIGLGAQSESNEACGIAGLALASGRFSHAGEKLETVTECDGPIGVRLPGLRGTMRDLSVRAVLLGVRPVLASGCSDGCWPNELRPNDALFRSPAV